MERRCELCEFWGRWAEGVQVYCLEVISDCRRYPPQMVVVDGQMACCWPEVDSAHWCGEFQRREQGKDAAHEHE